jgi:hypothetical protein
MNTLSNRSLAMLEANFIHAVLGSMFEAVLFTGTIKYSNRITTASPPEPGKKISDRGFDSYWYE